VVVGSLYSCRVQSELAGVSGWVELTYVLLHDPVSVLACSAFLFGSDGNFVFGRSYSNERLTVSLDSCTECRAGLTIRDLQTFTIWCRRFSAFFTRFEIPADLFDVSHMMSHDLMPHDAGLVYVRLV